MIYKEEGFIPEHVDEFKKDEERRRRRRRRRRNV
jgi:hypothetical protein